MLDNIQMLSGVSELNFGGSSDCKCGESSSSGAFDMAMMSLLKAIGTKNKIDSDNGLKMDNVPLGLNTQNTVINSNRVETVAKDEDTKTRIDNAVKISSQKYGVDENLVRAIIKVESNFNPNCVSKAGAKGLMQLMPENCRDLGVADPFNIEQNIDGGTRHIKEYLDKYNGDVEMALMAYNGGPTRMAKRGVKSINDIYKMPKETQNYVPKVMKYYKG